MVKKHPMKLIAKSCVVFGVVGSGVGAVIVSMLENLVFRNIFAYDFNSFPDSLFWLLSSFSPSRSSLLASHYFFLPLPPWMLPGYDLCQILPIYSRIQLGHGNALMS